MKLQLLRPLGWRQIVLNVGEDLAVVLKILVRVDDHGNSALAEVCLQFRHFSLEVGLCLFVDGFLGFSLDARKEAMRRPRRKLETYFGQIGRASCRERVCQYV